MQTGNTPWVVIVFQDNAQAKQAIADLEKAGFHSDQIRYSVKRGGGGIAADLKRIGLPDLEASFYNDQFEQGYTIVMVNTPHEQEKAYDILMDDGGFNANMGDVRTQNFGPYATTTNSGTTTAVASGTIANPDTVIAPAPDMTDFT